MAAVSKRYILMKPLSAEEAASALAAPEPALSVADLFIHGKTKASKRSDEFISPEPGQSVFDTQEAVLHVNDGTSVHAGRPCTRCPDCDGDLVLEKSRSWQEKSGPFTYVCENRDSGDCRATCSAKVDGSLKGVPANAETRRARRLTREMFDDLWRRCPSVVNAFPPDRKTAESDARARAYRWFAHAMELTGRQSNISALGIEDLRRAYRLCRDTDPAVVDSYTKENVPEGGGAAADPEPAQAPSPAA